MNSNNNEPNKMKKNKTVATESDVDDYLNAISDENRRNDLLKIIALTNTITGLEPKMWGKSIVGFGSYHYKYESGREGDAPLAGFAARANAIVLYLSLTAEQRDDFLPVFGKHKTGKGCIYIQKLQDIDPDVLNELITSSIENNKSKYQ